MCLPSRQETQSESSKDLVEPASGSTPRLALCAFSVQLCARFVFETPRLLPEPNIQF